MPSKIDFGQGRSQAGAMIQNLGLNVFEAVVKAGGMAADDIAAQGALRAPIDKGDLRRSIYREGDYAISEMTGKQVVTFQIRAARDYAAIQHENSSFNHTKGGEDHYLTRPARERRAMYTAFLQKMVREAMRKTAVENAALQS